MAESLAQTPLLELDLLKTLVAISDYGNFSAAAEAVHRTPSAVSMQVKRIEDLIGRPVFQRNARSVSVTAEGEVLLEHGRRVLALNSEIVKQFIEPEISGGVRLGVPDNLAERSMPAMLRQFGQTHCCVTVDVVVDDTEQLKKRVKSGELEMALVTCDPGKKKERDLEIIHREKLVWAGKKNGIACERDPLPISVWEEGCHWRKSATQSLKSHGRNFRIAFMCAHISGQKAAVLADLVVAPIPQSGCTGEIIELGSEHGLPPIQDYGLAIAMGKKPSAPVLAAADYFRSAYA